MQMWRARRLGARGSLAAGEDVGRALTVLVFRLRFLSVSARAKSAVQSHVRGWAATGEATF